MRAVRKLTDAVLQWLSPEFDGPYADLGRSSIAQEYILRALLLQVFFSVRLLVDRCYALLYRWFVGLGMGEWDRLTQSRAVVDAAEAIDWRRPEHQLRPDGSDEPCDNLPT